jgi:Asp-tRNA(Asn)/Glu-tRNA(Gln) amidotransferase A subunit family amidase
MTPVAGVRFTRGCSVFAAAAAAVAPPPSPPFVRLLEEKGGVVMGKTNTPEVGREGGREE